ncbi:hypothetical protein LRP49_17450 [Enterovibrio sp. ZSDZ35]|uniref:Uncharacterized protein n=1 Tax=Enterovibrio qingdaonensis TaxID=2899818 RepID=A0ABT5QPQ8_9GAMM|nr:hypothetical protein [Enterovibrio sp. ZSDZ35]MDD1782961.1 hypothetical protein [Enterovibrio sp. ZSDZ35]
MEVRTLQYFGVEYLTIAQPSDLPMILFRYPEMILFVVYGGVTLYAFIDLYEAYLSKNLSRANLVSPRLFSSLMLILCGAIVMLLFWNTSTPVKRSEWISNKSFPNSVLINNPESGKSKCYGLITATSTHLVLYDSTLKEALTIQKSSIDEVRWPYMKVKVTSNGECLVYDSLEDYKASKD